MLAQPLGLAEAMGASAEVRLVPVRHPWDWLPGRVWLWPLYAPRDDAAIQGDPPDLILSCGNVAAPIAAALRVRFRVPAVHLQNPKLPLDRFDLVVGQAHDRLRGTNVVTTRLALHRVSEVRLVQGAAEWSSRLAFVPHPRIGVLLGGPNGRLQLGVPEALGLVARLAEAAPGAGLLITPSRRTPPQVREVLRSSLPPSAFLWDMQGPNPLLGILALANALVVTEDSVSMVSEALATTAPLHVAALPGRRSRRIDAFVADLAREGLLRRVQDGLVFERRPAVNETPGTALVVLDRLGWPGRDA